MKYAAVLIIGACASVRAATIDYASFPETTTGLTLLGNSSITANMLRVTPSVGGQVGAAWFNQKQAVADGFDTNFTFRFSNPNIEGDGLAFVVQNSSLAAIGNSGQGIGYAGIPDSLAVEFDTWYNGSAGNAPYPNHDPSNNHIGFMSRGTAPNSDDHQYEIASRTNFDYRMSNGQPQTIRVHYVPGQLEVYREMDTAAPFLAANVNLSDLLDLDNRTAWVGFTASTGFGSETHDILDWQFAPLPEPSGALISLGLLGAAAVSRRRRLPKAPPSN